MAQAARLLRAVDSLGGDAPNDLLGVLDEGGTLVCFGSMVSLTLSLHVDKLLYKPCTVRGFWAARRGARSSADERARWLQEIVQMVLAGTLVLPVEQAFALADIGAALATDTRPRSGKIALRA
ncbi:MAG: zinc-binding dehydrogenase [Burkholderiales bacterium]|nr:zinc-binding dehydrogenase [Burkholderiales bacterium]